MVTICSKKSKNGKILSIDLIKMENINNTMQIIGDFTETNYQAQIKEHFKSKVDVVVSDMAVNTTGNKKCGFNLYWRTMQRGNVFC